MHKDIGQALPGDSSTYSSPSSFSLPLLLYSPLYSIILLRPHSPLLCHLYLLPSSPISHLISLFPPLPHPLLSHLPPPPLLPFRPPPLSLMHISILPFHLNIYSTPSLFLPLNSSSSTKHQ